MTYGHFGLLQVKPWIHELYPTKGNKKSIRDFEPFLVQGIRAHSDSIWVSKFSSDGQFLATGGKDAVLKIWQVNQVQTQLKVQVDDPKLFAEQMSDVYKVINSVPFREYREHEYDILDIAWSCNNDKPYQLLTCSLDCKVILWDLNKDTHVQIFEHPDVPTKICFNPDVRIQSISLMLCGSSITCLFQ